MRDIEATIKQARALGSTKRLSLSEVMGIRLNAINDSGNINTIDLIMDSYDFGFMIGFRMGRKKSACTMWNVQAD